MSSIKKDNLYSEESFIRFCQGDRFDGVKLGKRVTADFLKAAETDGLIIPLLVEQEKRKSKDEEEKLVEVRYYSPFQIFLVAALLENNIDEGVLRAPDNVDWQKQQGTRYIDWGGGSQFNVDHYEKKRSDEPEDLHHNAMSIADDFQNILKLVHSLEPEERYEYSYNKRRLHNGTPILCYNMDPVKDSAFVEKFDLSLKRMKRVIISVGYIATRFDPLEHWFYYIRKHPQFRRDQLKGPASLAQDLYGFCDIAYDLVKKVYGEELPPFLDLLHPDIKPYHLERAEFASGEDLEAIKSAFLKLQTWVNDNEDLIEEMNPQLEYAKIISILGKIKSKIDDFESRYGDRRYVGSRRTYRAENFKLEDLDEHTRGMVESLTKQRIQHEEMDGKRVSENDKQKMIAYEISFSISRTLSDLARSVSDMAYQISKVTSTLYYKAESQKETVKIPAIEDFHKSVNKSDPDYPRKHAEFWRTGIKEYEKPFQDRMDQIKSFENELRGIGNLTRLVFCAACRKNLVQKHYSHNDGQITEEAVCDECFETEATKIMLGTDRERADTTYAEWHCDRCDQLLLKFAIGNVVAARTINKTSMQVVLEYGHAKVEAKCPNFQCGHVNHRPLDWGWTS